MKEEHFNVGAYKQPPITQTIKAGVSTGVLSGIIFAVCFSIFIFISDITANQPGGYPSDFSFYLGFLMFILTLIGAVIGALFGTGFSYARQRKTQFYKHLTHDWIRAWTGFISITLTLITGINTFGAVWAMLITLCCSLVACLIGAYVGVSWFELE